MRGKDPLLNSEVYAVECWSGVFAHRGSRHPRGGAPLAGMRASACRSDQSCVPITEDAAQTEKTSENSEEPQAEDLGVSKSSDQAQTGSRNQKSETPKWGATEYEAENLTCAGPRLQQRRFNGRARRKTIAEDLAAASSWSLLLWLSPR